MLLVSTSVLESRRKFQHSITKSSLYAPIRAKQKTRGHLFTNKDQKLCQVCTRAGNGPWVSRTSTAWDLKKLNVINESNIHPKILHGSGELIYVSHFKFFSQLCNPSSLTHLVHISETPFFNNSLLGHATSKGPVLQITLID